VCDRRGEQSFGRFLLIDVDPLMVTGRLSELANLMLRYRVPVAEAEVGSMERSSWSMCDMS
jgi:hypothetical protein